ncbi:MAG TPA: hypothetical protein VHG70_03280 [Nocardioidaceae bacterium]|nr:hypothetical protein [Nocardioidaceae bacterium]
MLIPYAGAGPVVAPEAWVAPTATLVGAVTLHAEASAWYGAVLRGDGDSTPSCTDASSRTACWSAWAPW